MVFGMEEIPSRFVLLSRLKASGYGKLLAQMLQTRDCITGQELFQ